MSNFDKFLETEASDLLSGEEMAILEGGLSGTSAEMTDINALGHCGANNCHGGNCVAGCGQNQDSPTQS